MINVIPKPNLIVEKSERFTLTEGMGIVCAENLEPLANRFIEDVADTYGVKLQTSKQGMIHLRIIENPGQGNDEGYTLVVEGYRILLEAFTAKGIAYGLSTLYQLIESGEEMTIPCLSIKDTPAYPWRGYMLDESRHFFGKEYVKKILDAMAFYKLNLFHWHLTDDQGWRIEIKKYPKLTAVGGMREEDGEVYKGYYTQEDIREIVDYARVRHITIMPEIDIPGHLSAAIAAYPYLSCSEEPITVPTRYGILYNIACAGKDSTYRFAYDVLDEVCQLFPGPYIHIGGDEVPKENWKQCEHCQQKIEEEHLGDEEALQGYFTNAITEHLKAKGKKTLVWNDILKAGNLNGDVIVHHWMDGVKRSRTKKAVNGGYKVVVSDMFSLYLDYPNDVITLKKVYGFNPVLRGITETENVLGVQANLWTEHVPTTERADTMTFPRMLALSEVAWTERKEKSYRGFLRRLKHHDSYLEARGIHGYPLDRVNPSKVKWVSSLVKHIRKMKAGTKE